MLKQHIQNLAPNTNISIDQLTQQVRQAINYENSETDGGGGHYGNHTGYVTARNNKQPPQNSSLIPIEYQGQTSVMGAPRRKSINDTVKKA